ncbi:hypothetical protein J6590_085906 [Homalodisca vitripennis]|nr:hypothetical protein J6590_085906 [Homalodisca vitripennis]
MSAAPEGMPMSQETYQRDSEMSLTSFNVSSENETHGVRNFLSTYSDNPCHAERNGSGLAGDLQATAAASKAAGRVGDNSGEEGGPSAATMNSTIISAISSLPDNRASHAVSFDIIDIEQLEISVSYAQLLYVVVGENCPLV